MTSQRGKQTIGINISPNISRCRGNQAIQFDQLIECNMRKKFSGKIIHNVMVTRGRRYFNGC